MMRRALLAAAAATLLLSGCNTATEGKVVNWWTTKSNNLTSYYLTVKQDVDGRKITLIVDQYTYQGCIFSGDMRWDGNSC